MRDIIIRTAAAGRPHEDIRADLDYFNRIWTEVRRKSEALRAPAVVYREESLVAKLLRDLLTDEFVAIRIDHAQEYQEEDLGSRPPLKQRAPDRDQEARARQEENERPHPRRRARPGGPSRTHEREDGGGHQEDRAQRPSKDAEDRGHAGERFEPGGAQHGGDDPQGRDDAANAGPRHGGQC